MISSQSTDYNSHFRSFFARILPSYQRADEQNRILLLEIMRDFVEEHRDFVMQYPFTDRWGTIPAETRENEEKTLFDRFSNRSINLYFHIPFCARRCTYCNFRIIEWASLREQMMETYLSRLLAELDRFLLVAHDFTIETLFIGGGTPSFLPTHLLDKLVTWIQKRLGKFFEPTYEWTCEANPDSLSSEKIQLLRYAWVNRISLGIQSFDSQVLAKVHRTGNRDFFIKKIQEIRQAGFSSINADLMFGLPWQSPEIALEDVRLLTEIWPEHITAYPLYRYSSSKLGEDRHVAKTEDIYRLYRAHSDILAEHGYIRYGREYSCHTPEHIAQYSLAHRTLKPLLGFGLSAYSYVDGSLALREHTFKNYLQTHQTLLSHTSILPDDLWRRRCILGVRCNTIVLPEIQMPAFLSPILEYAILLGFLTKTNNEYHVTPRGMEYQEILIHLFV